MGLAKINNESPTIDGSLEGVDEGVVRVTSHRQSSKTPSYLELSLVDGNSWTVDYFKQNLYEHDIVQTLDPLVSASLQEYELIKKYDIKVLDGLESTVDPDTGGYVVSGSGIIYGPFKPNLSDVFKVKLLDGEIGLFSITEINSRTHRKVKAFVVNYVLLGVLSTPDVAELYETLQTKTVRVYHYDKDASVNLASPLITDNNLNKKKTLNEYLKTSIRHYFNAVMDNDTMSIIIPELNVKIFDPMLNGFIYETVSTVEHKNIVKINKFDLDHTAHFKGDTFWDALLNKDKTMLTEKIHKVGLLSKSAFNMHSPYNGIGYSIIDYVVVPYDLSTLSFKDNILSSMVSDNPTLSAIGNNVGVDSEGNTVTLVPDIDDFYVLSEEFYTETLPLTMLGKMVQRYLNNDSVDVNDIILLASNINNWNPVQKFYYVPILWLLIKTEINSLYGAK